MGLSWITQRCVIQGGIKKSRLSQRKQAKLIEYFTAGTPAHMVAELVRVNKTTAAWRGRSHVDRE